MGTGAAPQGPDTAFARSQIQGGGGFRLFLRSRCAGSVSLTLSDAPTTSGPPPSTLIPVATDAATGPTTSVVTVVPPKAMVARRNLPASSPLEV